MVCNLNRVVRVRCIQYSIRAIRNRMYRLFYVVLCIKEGGMNKTKVFGYAVGVASIAWSIYLISTGRILFAVIFFGLGCVALEVADKL